MRPPTGPNCCLHSHKSLALHSLARLALTLEEACVAPAPRFCSCCCGWAALQPPSDHVLYWYEKRRMWVLLLQRMESCLCHAQTGFAARHQICVGTASVLYILWNENARNIAGTTRYLLSCQKRQLMVWLKPMHKK